MNQRTPLYINETQTRLRLDLCKLILTITVGLLGHSLCSLLLRRMKLAYLLLVCVQVLRCGAGRNESPLALASADCNDPEAEEAADLSLDWLNENLKAGSILGLQRINSVHKQSEEDNSTVYYLALDVVETECPVQSREHWKDCERKRSPGAVIGQCKLVFHVKTPVENSALYKYDCTLKPDPSNWGCAGCHMSKPLDEPRFQRLAEKSLTKFNKDSNLDFHYALGNITKGTVQVVAGAIYRVEYLIHETDCNKSETTGDRSLCQASDSTSAHTGYCKSEGYAHFSNPDEPIVKVSCKIFESEDDANSEEVPDHPGNPGDGKRGKKHGHSHHKHGRKHGHKHRQKHGHEHGHKHGHKHSHKHDHDHSESHEGHHHHHHRHHHHHHRHNDTNLGCGHPDFFDKPVGRITYVTVESTAVPGFQDRGKPRFSVGSSFPGGPRKHKGDRPPPPSFGPGEHAGPPQLCKPSRPFLHRFPEQASTSAQCPGQIKNFFLGVPPDVTHSPQEPTPIPK